MLFVDNPIPPPLCKICGESFDTHSKLHRHIVGTHKETLSVYYPNFYALKENIGSKALKHFSTLQQYFQCDFDSPNDFYHWWIKQHPKIQQMYLIKLIDGRIKYKELRFAPCHLELKLMEIPDASFFRPNYVDALKINKLAQPLFPKFDFGWAESVLRNNEEIKNSRIIVDTREKHELFFDFSVKQKLDYGDYSIDGITSVERKSYEDFCNTLGKKNLKRFEKEIQRCVKNNGYLYIVMESGVGQFYNNTYTTTKYRNYLFSTIKTLLHKYPRRIQFVFTGGRETSAQIIPILLWGGKDFWPYDWQYMVDFKMGEMMDKVGVAF